MQARGARVARSYLPAQPARLPAAARVVVVGILVVRHVGRGVERRERFSRSHGAGTENKAFVLPDGLLIGKIEFRIRTGDVPCLLPARKDSTAPGRF